MTDSATRAYCAPAFVFCLLSFAALCVGIFVEQWYDNDVTGMRFGLFKNCSKIGCMWAGFAYPSEATRPFFLVQILLVAAGFVALLGTCLSMIPITSGALQITSGSCAALGAILFGLEVFLTESTMRNAGWSYYITVAAAAVLLINGFVLLSTVCCPQPCCTVTFGPCVRRKSDPRKADAYNGLA